MPPVTSQANVSPNSRYRPVLLYVIKQAQLGGAPLHVLQLIQHFRQDYDVHLCVGDLDYLSEQAKTLEIPIYQLGSLQQDANFLSFIRMFGELNRLIQTVDADLVHFHSPLVNVVGRFVCRILGKQSVSTVHGWNFVPGLPWKRRLSSWILEFISVRLRQTIISVSEYDRLKGQKYLLLPSWRITVIHNGLPATIVNAPALIENDNKGANILMVARFTQQKNQRLLIDAVERLSSKNWMLTFAGDGETLEDIKRYAASKACAAQITFLGTVHDVPKLLKTADIFVLATHYEGLPLSIIEAMRSGLPIVANDVGGISELVRHDENGLLCPANSTDAMANALEALINTPKTRTQLGKTSQQRFSNEFTDTVMFEKTAKVYQRLLSKNKK